MSALHAVGSDVRGPLDVTTAAAVVLNAKGTVVGWSPAAEALLGYRQSEVVGRSFASLCEPAPDAHVTPGPGRPAPSYDDGADDGTTSGSGSRSGRGAELHVRHRDGHVLRLATTACSLEYENEEQPARILLAADMAEVRRWETGQAMLRGLISQSPIGLAIYDTELGAVWANTASGHELPGPFAEYAGLHVDDLYPGGTVLSEGYPQTLEPLLKRVLDTGEPVIDLHYRAPVPADPQSERIWSCSYYLLQDAHGTPLGVCEESVDITDRYKAEQRLDLLVRAGQRIGTTLDMTLTVRELADVAVPRFADAVTVDLLEDVLGRGQAVNGAPAAGRLIRFWEQPAEEDGSPVTPGSPDTGGEEGPEQRPSNYPGSSPQMRSLSTGRPVMERLTTGDESGAGRAGIGEAGGGGFHALLVVPLRTEGTTLGVVTFLRGDCPEPFDAGELELAGELVQRTAVCIDNARRFAREHSAALTLQHSLLPQLLPPQTAVELAYRYLPADNRAGVGGDWFDVIPLSGTRVGLVVGDVVGHGLGAAATMGRLRTTVRALARLDLAPDELLSRLDDLIGQAAKERSALREGSEEDEAWGATCLYAVYDPVSGECGMASAGHLPPLVVDPDSGLATRPGLLAGPPLGVGGMPFESTEVRLPEGSLLALFTDGLVHAADRDVDTEVDRLRGILTEHARSLEEVCDHAVTTLLPGPVADDAALLVARTRRLGPEQSAVWELAADPENVAYARKVAAEQLEAWELGELEITMELVVSELVTNAIRHAGGPVHLRLIRDQTLICEVSDTGHTSPHLRHAASDDEGGRGLFLVAQMTEQWGTRYTPTGKTIWAEQDLPGTAPPNPVLQPV